MKPDIRKRFLHIIAEPQTDLPWKVDWKKALKWLFDEQVQSIVFRQVDHNLVPESTFECLEKAYYGALVANTYRTSAIKELEPLLAQKNLHILIEKGAALINNAYPDPGMRLMEDIDVLIKPEDLNAFEKILIQTGYKNKPNYPLMFERAGVKIDLHTHFLHTDRIESRRYFHQSDMEQVWENSVPWAKGFEYIRRPDETDHLIFLSHHLIKHSFSKLIWIIDVYRIIKNMETSVWQKLSDKLPAIYQKRPIYYVLYLLESMFDCLPPKDSGFSGYKRHLSFMEKKILDLRSCGQSMGDFGNVLWLFCIPGFKARVRYGLETLFPKKDVLQREQSLNTYKAGSVYFNRSTFLIRSLFDNLGIVFKNFLRRFSF